MFNFEDFREQLRNLIVFWLFLQVVVNPGDPVLQPDGAALSAFQYFENVRNFLVAVQELGIPTFQASDLEQVILKLLRIFENFVCFCIIFSTLVFSVFLIFLIPSKLLISLY